MLPDFDRDGNLPPGVHEAQWDEIVRRFGWTSRRRKLLEGLKVALGRFAKPDVNRFS